MRAVAGLLVLARAHKRRVADDGVDGSNKYEYFYCCLYPVVDIQASFGLETDQAKQNSHHGA